MRLSDIFTRVFPSACVIFAMGSASAWAQTDTKADAPKPAAVAKQLKPQTTCPVTGDPIDKSLYVDYKGKRIYVCCSSCLPDLRKDPEKYIKKLESMGQSVETIPDKTKKKAHREARADTSMKGMDMKGMNMPADTTAKGADMKGMKM